MSKKCAICGNMVEDGSISCPSCGRGIFESCDEDTRENGLSERYDEARRKEKASSHGLDHTEQPHFDAMKRDVGSCDICSSECEGTVIGAPQMRRAVSNRGFDPFKMGLTGKHGDPAKNFAWWKNSIVFQDPSDWSLCARCWEKISPYLDGKPEPTGVRESYVSIPPSGPTSSRDDSEEKKLIRKRGPASDKRPAGAIVVVGWAFLYLVIWDVVFELLDLLLLRKSGEAYLVGFMSLAGVWQLCLKDFALERKYLVLFLRLMMTGIMLLVIISEMNRLRILYR